MAWTEPKTWAAGVVLTAAELNEQVRDNLSDLDERIENKRAHGVKANRTTSQSIPDASFTEVIFNAADTYDTDGLHDPGSNPTRITINDDAIPTGETGIVGLTVRLKWDVDSTGRRVIKFVKNGSVFGGTSIDANATGDMYQTLHEETEAVDGDYFEVTCYQDSGGSLAVEDAIFTLTVYGLV